MPKEAKREREERGAFTICPHGSSYCSCRGNLVLAIALPGRPKYDRSNGARKTGKKGKMRKRTKVNIAAMM